MRRIALLAVVALALAACTKAVEVNQPSSSGSRSTATTKAVAHTGATLALKAADGQTASVTLTKVIDPASGADQFTTPDPGKRFVATVFTITNTSHQAVQGDANNDVSVIGSDNQSYSPDFSDVAECTNFNSGSFNLGAGESVSGCVVFQVPTAVTVAKVQFTPSAGFASDFGEWLNP